MHCMTLLWAPARALCALRFLKQASYARTNKWLLTSPHARTRLHAQLLRMHAVRAGAPAQAPAAALAAAPAPAEVAANIAPGECPRGGAHRDVLRQHCGDCLVQCLGQERGLCTNACCVCGRRGRALAAKAVRQLFSMTFQLQLAARPAALVHASR